MGQLAANGTALESLVVEYAGSAGAPVVLQDADLRVLAAAGEISGLALDPSRCHATRHALRQMSGQRRPVRLDVGSRSSRLVVPVVLADEVFGYLTVPAPPGVEPGPGGGGTSVPSGDIERLAAAAAVELAVERRLAEILDQDEEEFFADLLSGRRAPRILARGIRLGYELTREHIPLAFTVEARHDRAVAPETLDHLQEAVRSWVRREPALPAPIVGRDEDTVLVFLPTTDRGVALTLARDTLHGARRRGLCVAAGAGPVCRQPEEFGPAAGKAKWAARVRLIAGHRDLVASFDELGVGALLFKIDDRSQLQEFVTRWLGDLKRYDDQHQTQLTMSLRVLLETRSLRESAEALHVHTSTLKYRVKRINEILDADCQDPETSFNLQFALRIDEILEGQR